MSCGARKRLPADNMRHSGPEARGCRCTDFVKRKVAKLSKNLTPQTSKKQIYFLMLQNSSEAPRLVSFLKCPCFPIFSGPGKDYKESNNQSARVLFLDIPHILYNAFSIMPTRKPTHTTNTHISYLNFL